MQVSCSPRPDRIAGGAAGNFGTGVLGGGQPNNTGASGGGTGRTVRPETATALTDCSLLRIEKEAMVRALHEHAFSEHFLAYLLSRNLQYEEALVDHLFNSSEKRLARILLVLVRFGKEGKPEAIVPKISQETLAQMVGTTRARISFFMNKFRKLGFVEYNDDEIEVHGSLLNVVLHE